ncbi:MAG: glycosyltransferase family 2 protein [Geminicoccaceae bacterium]
MSKDMKLSVLMGVYDAERHLPAALASLFAQSFEDFELIVVDDGSTDGTADILASCEDPRLMVLTNTENIGLTRSLNRALARSRGALLARLDADDRALPDRFRLQVDWMETHPETVVLGSRYRTVSTEGGMLGTHAPPVSDGEIRWQMLFNNSFCHSAVMFRRSALECEPFAYDETLTSAQDYELWTRLLRQGEGANLPAVLVERCLHDQTITRMRHEEQQQIADDISRRGIEALIGAERARRIDVRRIRRALDRPVVPPADALTQQSFDDIATLFELSDIIIRRHCLPAPVAQRMRARLNRQITRALAPKALLPAFFRGWVNPGQRLMLTARRLFEPKRHPMQPQRSIHSG